MTINLNFRYRSKRKKKKITLKFKHIKVLDKLLIYKIFKND